jgi:butyryl-CoA dehydrogenase
VFGHTVIGWRWLEQAIRAEEGLAKGNAADVTSIRASCRRRGTS